MQIEDCFRLGHIIKKHGLHGELSILLDVDYPQDYQNLESVFVEINKQLVPFFIDHIQINGDKAIVKLEDVDNLEAVERLKSCNLYLPEGFLPQLGEGQFYYHEVIGYEAVDKLSGTVGIINNIYEFPNQDLFGVDHQGQEVLIPINDEIIIKVDHDSNRIEMNLPDGLLDVYKVE